MVFEAGLTGDGCIQCLSIAIVNDTVYEGDDQRFSVMGGNVGLGCVFSADDTATVYITENPEDGTSMHIATSVVFEAEMIYIGYINLSCIILSMIVCCYVYVAGFLYIANLEIT